MPDQLRFALMAARDRAGTDPILLAEFAEKDLALKRAIEELAATKELDHISLVDRQAKAGGIFSIAIDHGPPESWRVQLMPFLEMRGGCGHLVSASGYCGRCAALEQQSDRDFNAMHGYFR